MTYIKRANAVDYMYGDKEEYDFQKISNIVKVMDHLRIEAKNSGDQEIYTLINSAFNICFTSYYLALRMQALEETGEIPNEKH